ncbi:DUF1304 domain-containing protein [Demequina gelatinilytica]|uniref:DUF1304 domain-containing protein n=1 Tax=Demequina gelatinilytica TaxID=1638980 RepID=UPI000783D44B|nr:DUF1304 domain-containing protein [Demequina gelatinilytica]
MIAVTLVLAGLASLVHVYIFWLESVAWMRPATRRVFGIASEEEARTTRALAFNQGFYNLFLATVTGVGIVLLLAGEDAPGAALIYAGCGSMALAALVLVAGSRAYASAAAKQGLAPLLAVLALTVAIV